VSDEKQNPSVRLRFSQAVKYLKNTHGLTITRQTLHNWSKVGVGGTKLNTIRLGWSYYTAKSDLDVFVGQLSSRPS
jgi:hypothetical protein